MSSAGSNPSRPSSHSRRSKLASRLLRRHEKSPAAGLRRLEECGAASAPCSRDDGARRLLGIGRISRTSTSARNAGRASVEAFDWALPPPIWASVVRNGSGSQPESANSRSAPFGHLRLFEMIDERGRRLTPHLAKGFENARLRHTAEIIVDSRPPAGCCHVEVHGARERVGMGRSAAQAAHPPG